MEIIFSKDLTDVLKKLEADNNYIAFEMLSLTDPDVRVHNGLKITNVDISKVDYHIDVTIGGNKHSMKIGKFIRYFFKDIMTDYEITKFSNLYNSIKNGEPSDVSSTPIIPGEFKFDPKNPRSTFLSMVTKTYPHGHEDEVLTFLPKLDKDIVGNYYKIIPGDDETMFTSHLDTADRKQGIVSLYSAVEEDEEYIITNGSTILGADDKAGVTVMLYMMAHNIPGIYYFFIGEERGGIGSNKLANVYDSVEYLKDVKRCISFDRRNYYSVITEQLGKRCCSDVFGNELCKEYKKGGLNLKIDPTGIYTDSASFIDIIPECTNVSVGYMHEHTGKEYQNMTYLESLCSASLLVDWKNLPTNKRVGVDKEVVKKNKELIDDFKKSIIYLENRIVGENGRVYISVSLEDIDIDTLDEGMSSISIFLKKWKIDPDIIFGETCIKIELK